MPVEDVSVPGAKRVTDVKGSKDKDSADYWERMADEAAAKAKYLAAERDIDRIVGGGGKEPAFQVKGSVDLGNVSYQDMIREQTAERDRLRQEAEDNAQRQANANETLRAQLHQQELKLLQEVSEKNIEITKLALQAQIEKMAQMIGSNSNKKSFMEEYNEAMQIATALGLAKPSAENTDLKSTIELKKLEFENNRELRRLAREEKAQDRQWQLDLRRLDDERESRKKELEQQAKKDEMFANFPKYIGAALAEGLAARAEGVSANPSANSKQATARGITAKVGESGEIECPDCGTSVGIGPNAQKTVCAGCGQNFIINRVSPDENTEELTETKRKEWA